MHTVESLKRATTTQLTALGLPSALAEVLCRLVRKLYRAWHKVKPGRVQNSISSLVFDERQQQNRASSPLSRERSSVGSRGLDKGFSANQQDELQLQNLNEHQVKPIPQRGLLQHEQEQGAKPLGSS